MNTVECGQLALIDSEESILEHLRKIIVKEKKYTFYGPQIYTWKQIGKKYQEVINEAKTTN
jgi:hypothetical protein